MEQSPEQPEAMLRHTSSVLSDASFGSNSTVVASPPLPTSHRPGYRRVPSVVEETPLLPTKHKRHPSSEEISGLGITHLDDREDERITRHSVGSKPSQSTFNSIDPLVTPVSPEPSGGGECNGKSHYTKDEQECLDNPSTTSQQKQTATDPFDGSVLLDNENRAFSCRSRASLTVGRGNYIAVTILFLSIYSTVFSALWLSIAILKPRYGNSIATAGKISPQATSILYAAFAKSIELSFVTVVVALLGQVLSKRALGDQKSITIAEMSMRSWVLQPGTMLTHPQSIRYAAITRLGFFSILAAIMAMIYTTASDALVAPKLKFGKNEHRLIYGKVSTDFANKQVIEDRCPTPIQQKDDSVDYGTTCIQIQHAGEAYHNYMQYLGTWYGNIRSGNGSTDLKRRPDPVGVKIGTLYARTPADSYYVDAI